MWVGEKTDVTDGVIAAVYEWFMAHMNDENGPIEEYKITYPSTEFELVMRRKQPEDAKQEERTCEK